MHIQAGQEGNNIHQGRLRDTSLWKPTVERNCAEQQVIGGCDPGADHTSRFDSF